MIAVIFEAKVIPEQQTRYFKLAESLKPLLTEIEGFISIERFQSITPPDKILSLSWWRDEEAIHQWKTNILHQSAQAEGRQSIFSSYQIRVVQVIRDYASTMTESTSHV